MKGGVLSGQPHAAQGLLASAEHEVVDKPWMQHLDGFVH